MNLYLKLLENYISSILINATAVTVMVISLMKKSLSLEIQKYKASHDKGFSFMF